MPRRIAFLYCPGSHPSPRPAFRQCSARSAPSRSPFWSSGRPTSPRTRLHHFGKSGDFLYSTYSYAFPIRQYVVYSEIGTDVTTNVVLAAEIALIAGRAESALVREVAFAVARRRPPAGLTADTGRWTRRCPIGLTEAEGFEPPEPFGSAVFKTAAIDHSATPPGARRRYVRPVRPSTRHGPAAGQCCRCVRRTTCYDFSSRRTRPRGVWGMV